MSKKERNNVRKTWGKNVPEKVKILFMLGKESKVSHDESEQFGDILQSKVPIDDPAYEFKQLLIMLSWVYHSCPTLRFENIEFMIQCKFSRSQHCSELLNTAQHCSTILSPA